MEEEISKLKELYQNAYDKRITDFKEYTGDFWYYSKAINQYLSTKDCLTIGKNKYNKVYFRTKKDAQTYMRYYRKLLTLISIKVQQEIDKCIDGIDIDSRLREAWKEDFWYK